MLRQRRRIVANDERRVCIDRCATLTTTPSQLLHYVMRLRGCTETQRDILALLIHNRLPLRLSKEWIDALFSSDSISIIIDCLMVDDPKDLLRTCAGQIIAQIIAHDNAAHANGLQQYTLQANIVLPTDDSYATIRLQLVSQLLHIFGRTLNSIVANLIDDVIRKMIERAEFDDSMCWSDRILPPIRELLMGPMQSDRVLQIGLQFLALLTDGCGFRNRINHIVRYKFVPVLIRSITGPVAIQLVGLHVIKNISQGYDENIMDLLNGNLLVALKEILLASSALAGVRHLALDILSSLCGHRTEVAAIINAGLLPIVLDVMLNDDNELQILASCVVNNIANRGGIGEIMQAVQCGTVVALCKMLHRTDNDIISVRYNQKPITTTTAVNEMKNSNSVFSRFSFRSRMYLMHYIKY